MKLKISLIVLIFFCATNLHALDGNIILKKSDSVIIPESFKYDLTMTTYDPKGTKLNKMTGWKKGESKNVMIVTEPKRVEGSVNLRRSSTIWVYYTTNKKITQMAYQSIFMGSLLNYGDVMSAELSTDYEVIDTKENSDNYILNLTVKEGHEGYKKILLTINKANFHPIKKEYYALSGMLIKTCKYLDIKFNNGTLEKLIQEFYEPLKNIKTIVVFDNFKIMKNIPEKYYNTNYIKHFGD